MKNFIVLIYFCFCNHFYATDIEMDSIWDKCFSEIPTSLDEYLDQKSIDAQMVNDDYLNDSLLFPGQNDGPELENSSLPLNYLELPSAEFVCIDIPDPSKLIRKRPLTGVVSIPNNQKDEESRPEKKSKVSPAPKKSKINLNADTETTCKEFYKSLSSQPCLFDAFVCCLLANAGGFIVDADAGEIEFIDRAELAEYILRIYDAELEEKRTIVSRFCLNGLIKENFLDRFRQIVGQLRPELKKSRAHNPQEQVPSVRPKLLSFSSLMMGADGKFQCYRNNNSTENSYFKQSSMHDNLKFSQTIFSAPPMRGLPATGNLSATTSLIFEMPNSPKKKATYEEYKPKRMFNYLIEKTDKNTKAFKALVCCLYAGEGGRILDVDQGSIKIPDRNKLIGCIYNVLEKEVPKDKRKIISSHIKTQRGHFKPIEEAIPKNTEKIIDNHVVQPQVRPESMTNFLLFVSHLKSFGDDIALSQKK